MHSWGISSHYSRLDCRCKQNPHFWLWQRTVCCCQNPGHTPTFVWDSPDFWLQIPSFRHSKSSKWPRIPFFNGKLKYTPFRSMISYEFHIINHDLPIKIIGILPVRRWLSLGRPWRARHSLALLFQHHGPCWDAAGVSAERAMFIQSLQNMTIYIYIIYIYIRVYVIRIYTYILNKLIHKRIYAISRYSHIYK